MDFLKWVSVLSKFDNVFVAVLCGLHSDHPDTKFFLIYFFMGFSERGVIPSDTASIEFLCGQQKCVCAVQIRGPHQGPHTVRLVYISGSQTMDQW